MLSEADVVLVCHDGRVESNPMDFVSVCGADRCIIVLTRGLSSRADVSYMLSWLKTTTSAGFLVPIVPSGGNQLFYEISKLLPYCTTAGSRGFVALE